MNFMDLRMRRLVLFIISIVGGVVGNEVFWRANKAAVGLIGLDLRLDKIPFYMYQVLAIILIGVIIMVVLDAFMKTEILKS